MGAVQEPFAAHASRILILVICLAALASPTDSAPRTASPLPPPPPRRVMAGAAAARPKRQPPPPRPSQRPQPAAPRRRCPELPSGSTASADRLLTSGPGVPYADFLVGIRTYGLQGELRQAARGKVLVVPSNAAMADHFVPRGLYRQRRSIPPEAVKELRRLVQTVVAVPRSSIPFRLGCGDLYISHRLGSRTRIALVKPKKGRRGAGGVTAAAVGDPDRYSVLGQGYNVINGLPLSVGMSSLDPGLTLQPVFRFNSSNVRSMPTTGGACTSQFSTTVYNSMSSMKEKIGASMSISADFGVASLSGNAQFSSLSKTSSTSQTITTNSGAQVYLGGVSLGAGPGYLELDPDFVANVRPLVAAAKLNAYDQYAMQSLMDNYGTHYVSTVFWGGLAAVTTQMTASTYSSFKETDVSVSIAAQVAVVQVSASVDYNSVETNQVRSNSQTFGMTLIPSIANLALANTSPTAIEQGQAFIDCVGWTNALREAIDTDGWRPPVHYKVAPLTDLFSFPKIWPADMRPWLLNVQRRLFKFITSCGFLDDFDDWQTAIAANPYYSACPVVDPRCVKGTYESRRGGCLSCYNDGTSIGPYCNSTAVLACTAKSCYCERPFAPAAAIYGCTPLQGQPLALASENGYAVAQCPGGLVISSISDAAYGSGTSFSADSYREVYKQCIGQVYCAVQASNSVFGDPIAGVVKTLRFTWACDYPRFARAATDGGLASASCPGSCLAIGGIVRPTYGNLTESGCNSTTTYSVMTDKTKVQCIGSASCSPSATTNLFGDPCPGKTKYLQFHYSCTYPPATTKSASGAENSVVRAACPFSCQRITNITDGSYGEASCTRANVNAKVIALCPLNVASFCDVTASNTNFGDPCVNKAKTLTFNYECT